MEKEYQVKVWEKFVHTIHVDAQNEEEATAKAYAILQGEELGTYETDHDEFTGFHKVEEL